jgi:uncharacterized phage protein (TIGR02218 family)
VKNISTALQNYLNAFPNYTSTQFLMCEFYTITLRNGTVISFSSADVALIYNIPAQTVSGGVFYNPIGGMRISRGQMKTVVGTQVDQMDVTLYPSSSDTILGGGVPFEALSGTLDGAWVSIDRAFLTGWSSPGIVGTVNIFAGRVAPVTIGRTVVTLTIKSPLELLDLNFPRNVYQPGCLHNLFDSGCSLNAASFVFNGSVQASSAPNQLIFATGSFQPDTYYTLGYVTFTSGVLNGQSRSILYSQQATGLIQVSYPFPEAPSVGDTFSMYPGCDHAQWTCQGKFNNLTNFRGMPFVPPPETAS